MGHGPYPEATTYELAIRIVGPRNESVHSQTIHQIRTTVILTSVMVKHKVQSDMI